MNKNEWELAAEAGMPVKWNWKKDAANEGKRQN